VIAAPPPVYPWPIGAGARYHPGALSAGVAAGAPVGRMRCGAAGRELVVHVELFAQRRVVVVPSGIGVSPKGCRYPLRTSAPTGVVHVDTGRPRRLRDLFAVWGRRLRRDALLSFRGPVAVYVNGRRFRGDPGAVRLTRHVQVVVEVGGYVAPHPHYLFPKGLG
jgi:hypothetical protein